jgi:hypothetical protein
MVMKMSEKNAGVLESPTWRAKCGRFVFAKEHGYHRTPKVRTQGTRKDAGELRTLVLQQGTRQLPRFRALGEVKPILPALVVVLWVTMENMNVQISRVPDSSRSPFYGS